MILHHNTRQKPQKCPILHSVMVSFRPLKHFYRHNSFTEGSPSYPHSFLKAALPARTSFRRQYVLFG